MRRKYASFFSEGWVNHGICISKAVTGNINAKNKWNRTNNKYRLTSLFWQRKFVNQLLIPKQQTMNQYKASTASERKNGISLRSLINKISGTITWFLFKGRKQKAKKYSVKITGNTTSVKVPFRKNV
ncbi:MAG: hypothetical protein ABI921_13815 [Panacibacter sp.]